MESQWKRRKYRVANYLNQWAAVWAV